MLDGRRLLSYLGLGNTNYETSLVSTKRVDVRVESELWAEIEKFRATSGIETPSQALRMLAEMGLPRALQLDETWRRITYIEGVKAAAHTLREQVSRVVSESLRSTQ